MSAPPTPIKNPFQRSSIREISTDWIRETNDKYAVVALLKSDTFQECETYREQCHAIWNFLGFLGCTKNKCAHLLDVDHKAFEKQIQMPLEQRLPGRPKILNDDEIQILIEEIHRLISNGEYPTVNDMVQYIIENIEKCISPETIRNYIVSSGFNIVVGNPMEEDRAKVDDRDIDHYYDNLAQEIDGAPASLIFNMDEAGEDDYVDTRSYNVIVPSEYQGKSINIPVRRKSKRSTLIHCISCDGTYLLPLLIIPRKTVDSVIFKKLTPNNFLIQYQSKGFSNFQLIQFWLENIFFPEVRRRQIIEQERSNYQGYTYLIIDGCSSHAKALQYYDLEKMKIKIIYLVPHASHLLQPLDLVIFSLQKMFTTRKCITGKLTTQVDKLRRIIDGLHSASTPGNIVSSFEAAGVFHAYDQTMKNFNNSMPYVKVIKEKSRFKKDKNYTEENLIFRLDL